MATALVKRATPDRSKINMNDKTEIKYWTKHLCITDDDLRHVVGKVGNSAMAVLKELGKRM
jgi:hypothetical protein